MVKVTKVIEKNIKESKKSVQKTEKQDNNSKKLLDLFKSEPAKKTEEVKYSSKLGNLFGVDKT